MEKPGYTHKGWKNVLLFIVPYLLQLAFFQAAAFKILGYSLNDLPSNLSDGQSLFVSLFDLAGSLSLIWIFVRFIDKEDFVVTGFKPNNVRNDITLGLWIGFVIMFAALAGLLLSGQVTIQSVDMELDNLFYSIGLFVSVAIVEEVILRGYVLRNLMRSFNPFLALSLSAVLFAAMHMANPHLGVSGIIGIFLAGYFLGIGYVLTRNLWLPIALHFSWNFFQSLFGFNVSGQDKYSLFTLNYEANTIWNGGNFGFEGSVLTIPFQLVGILFIYYHIKKRNTATPYNS